MLRNTTARFKVCGRPEPLRWEMAEHEKIQERGFGFSTRAAGVLDCHYSPEYRIIFLDSDARYAEGLQPLLLLYAGEDNIECCCCLIGPEFPGRGAWCGRMNCRGALLGF